MSIAEAILLVVRWERREELDCSGPGEGGGGREELAECVSSLALFGVRASEGLTVRKGRRGVLRVMLAEPANRMGVKRL